MTYNVFGGTLNLALSIKVWFRFLQSLCKIWCSENFLLTLWFIFVLYLSIL